MSKEKRYILVRDTARIDYFIQWIIPTEDKHVLSHVFAEVPSCTEIRKEKNSELDGCQIENLGGMRCAEV